MRTERKRTGEDGIALVVASMATMLLLALGSALVLVTASESMIAANFRSGGEGLHAADAALERALSDLRDLPDWSQALNGTARSSFSDGAPFGIKRLPNGSTIDIDQVVNRANCRKLSACTEAEMTATTNERPWGANNPRWRPFAFGRLEDIVGGDPIESQFYLVALVADDPSENDDDPEADGTSRGMPNPGVGLVTLRGEAFGPGGSHRVVETTVERVLPEGGGAGPPFDLRVLSWREVR